MTALRDTLPEIQYALLFPDQPIPCWALETIGYLKSNEYILRGQQQGVVPVAKIVGTDQARYGNVYRWLDMLTIAQSSFNFELNNWPGFLNAKTTDIELARLHGTDDYYIIGEGNHRVSAYKLACKPTINCIVSEAYPNPNYTEQPIRLRDGYSSCIVSGTIRKSIPAEASIWRLLWSGISKKLWQAC